MCRAKLISERRKADLGNKVVEDNGSIPRVIDKIKIVRYPVVSLLGLRDQPL